MRELPVLSLWQPYASLIFTLDKRHETRSWRLGRYMLGKRIAIHATLAIPSPAETPADLDALARRRFGDDWRTALPRGAIIGTVVFSDCWPTEQAMMFQDITPNDIICGDWTPGRYAFRIDDVRALTAPVPAKGKQGWGRIEERLLAA